MQHKTNNPRATKFSRTEKREKSRQEILTAAKEACKRLGAGMAWIDNRFVVVDTNAFSVTEKDNQDEDR